MQNLILRLIASAQLLGVVLLLGAQLAAARQGYEFTFVYVAAVIAVASLATVASILLWRGHSWGLDLSIAMQVPQIFNASTAVFSFQFALGPVARLHLLPDGFHSQLGAYGQIGLAFGPLSQPLPVWTFNIAALAAFTYLAARRQKVGAKSASLAAAI